LLSKQAGSKCMAVGNCATCRQLLERVSLASARHLRAVSLLEATVQNDPDDRQIPSLGKLVRSCGIYRQDAVGIYEGHLLTHSAPVKLVDDAELACCA
jgi:hypothetical protein